MIRLNHKSDCCGCSACASVCGRSAIEMCADEEGFLYPRVDAEKCVHCGLCETVCPVLRYDKLETKEASPRVFAVRHRDPDTWSRSSSGGAFTPLVKFVLDRGGCVFGAAYNERMEVVHCKAETMEETLRFRGSKYVQSNLNGVYKQVRAELRSGRMVLFSGTPCQCEGLRGFLLKPYPNLVIVDIMCHCVPSPKLFADYVRFVEKKAGEKISKIFMKDKALGWGNQSPRITFRSGKEWFNTPETHLWNFIFYSQFATRPSCHECRFANYRHPGDITIGDFWGIEKSHPDFFDERGISLLFTNTPRGEEVFDAVKGDFSYLESDVRRCVQPNLIHPVSPNVNRDSFWRGYKRHSFRKVRSLYFWFRLKNRVKNKIKRCLPARIRQFIKR